MGRLVIIVAMLIISGIIYLVKAGASAVTGKEVNFKEERQKVMHTTAKGINWMNEEWEKAKSGNNTTMLPASKFSNMSAIEIIANVKSNPSKYNNAAAETFYIEQAVERMNNRQFDDAIKFVNQIGKGEAQSFMLTEIEEKRNA